MSKRTTSRSLFVILALGIGFVTAAPAFAIGVPAYAGNAYLQANDSCFTPYVGGVINNCNYGTGGWLISLPANAGSKSVTVATYNPGTGTFDCSLYAITQSGATSITGSPSVWYPNTGNDSKTFTVTVPNNGAMFLYCDMEQWGVIYTVNYNQ